MCSYTWWNYHRTWKFKPVANPREKRQKCAFVIVYINYLLNICHENGVFY